MDYGICNVCEQGHAITNRLPHHKELALTHLLDDET